MRKETPKGNARLLKYWRRRRKEMLDNFEFEIHKLGGKVSKEDGSYFVWVFLAKRCAELQKEISDINKELEKPIEEIRPANVL